MLLLELRKKSDKSQKTVSTFSVPIIRLSPFAVCPFCFKSAQDFGIPFIDSLTADCPVHSNRPKVWAPEELCCTIRPKLRRVIGKTLLSVITPLIHTILIYTVI